MQFKLKITDTITVYANLIKNGISPIKYVTDHKRLRNVSKDLVTI